MATLSFPAAHGIADGYAARDFAKLGIEPPIFSKELIYVVDSLDRERIGKAKAEFQVIIRDPFMLNVVILVFANKQDMKGAMTPMEVCEGLGLYDLKSRKWHIDGTCSLRGDELYEGLDWLASILKEHKAAGFSSTVGTSSF